MVITKQTERTRTDNAVRYGTEVSDRKETEMGKTFVEDERPCDSCVNATRYGCVSWNCEYINRDEVIKAWREKHETADRKTEPQRGCDADCNEDCTECAKEWQDWKDQMWTEAVIASMDEPQTERSE